MKYIFFLVISSLVLFSSCKSTLQKSTIANGWFNIAVTDDADIYIDTTSIKQEGNITYACEKRVYTTVESKKTYIDKIRNEYVKMNKVERVEKWNDFSYCIYNCLYECTNKRFRVLSVEDYDTSGKLILKTITPKNKIRWMNVDSDTVGDYTFFYVCDYQK